MAKISEDLHIIDFEFHGFSQIMSGSSHILSVLIAIEYQNCHLTLDVYLLYAIQSKLIYIFVTYGLASL